MPSNRLLITGAAGFTGRHLMRAAKQRGYECIALCHDSNDLIFPGQQSHIADLRDVRSLQRAIRESKPDFVVHLAGQANVAHNNPAEIYITNVVGTINLLEAIRSDAPNIQRVVLASSANIYGNVDVLPITEATPINPTNHYAISKWTMERAARLMETLPLGIARPFNYTGLGQSTTFVIPKIVSAFKAGQTSISLGNIDVKRDFSDVRDVANDYLAMIEHQSISLANLCSGLAISVRDAIAQMQEITGHEIQVETNPSLIRQGEITILYGQPNLALLEVRAEARHNFRDTLEWMLTSDNEH